MITSSRVSHLGSGHRSLYHLILTKKETVVDVLSTVMGVRDGNISTRVGVKKVTISVVFPVV